MNPIVGGPQILYVDLLDYLLLTCTQVRSDLLQRAAMALTSLGYMTGIGNVYGTAQFLYETANGASWRFRQNLSTAGMGATDTAAKGIVSTTIEEAFLKQYLHLLVYATTKDTTSSFFEALITADPRMQDAVRTYGRGSAVHWEDLGGKWAKGLDYGEKVGMIASLIQRGIPRHI